MLKLRILKVVGLLSILSCGVNVDACSEVFTGNLTVAQSNFNEGRNVYALTSYECNGTCYVVSGGFGGAASNVVYAVNANGTLTAVLAHGLNTGAIYALTSYECNGTCYVVSGGGMEQPQMLSIRWMPTEH